jgi:predicted O-methyltransferase YrrM
LSNSPTKLSEELYRYLQSMSLRETDVLRDLRQETAGLPAAVMQVAPEQGQFLAFLVQLIGARNTIEVGVFTGYSALAVALALPTDGQIIACDINKDYTSVAQRYWRRAGVAEKIELHLAPAVQSLQKLITDGRSNSFDFAFIDADKSSYHQYYEQCLQLLRRGGLIAVDNVLWGGSVINQEKTDADTQAIRQFNSFVKVDERVDLTMLSIGDGLTLLRKR